MPSMVLVGLPVWKMLVQHGHDRLVVVCERNQRGWLGTVYSFFLTTGVASIYGHQKVEPRSWEMKIPAIFEGRCDQLIEVPDFEARCVVIVNDFVYCVQ